MKQFSKWNVEVYKKFLRERTQPAVDLVNRIPYSNPKKIIDLGCGPGNSTEILKNHYKNSEVIGVDSSSNMIEEARKMLPHLQFRQYDIEDDIKELGSNYDIVFSNACIQWVPNHKELIPKLASLLKKDGI